MILLYFLFVAASIDYYNGLFIPWPRRFNTNKLLSTPTFPEHRLRYSRNEIRASLEINEHLATNSDVLQFA